MALPVATARRLKTSARETEKEPSLLLGDEGAQPDVVGTSTGEVRFQGEKNACLSVDTCAFIDYKSKTFHKGLA